MNPRIDIYYEGKRICRLEVSEVSHRSQAASITVVEKDPGGKARFGEATRELRASAGHPYRFGTSDRIDYQNLISILKQLPQSWRYVPLNEPPLGPVSPLPPGAVQ